MKHFLLIYFLFVSVLGFSQNANDLFFSEYVEGSSSNKYLEIFNGTGATVDLTDYEVILYSNGATTPTNTHALEGTLETGNVLVLKNSSATIYTGTAIESSTTNFNGDDAVVIKKISTGNYVDIIGKVGERTNWTSGSHSTLNKTLVRKPTIIEGVSTNPDAGFPTLTTEWDVFDVDYIDNLGSHTFSPSAPGTLTNFALSDYTVETGQLVTFTWDAVDVDLIKFQVYDPIDGWFDLEELTSVDATLGTLDFNVPTDATEGTFDMRIVDVNNSTVVSNTIQITITDVDFAGLDNTYPATGQVGVPTDLFFVFETDEGTNASLHRIILYFNEDIQAGTGNVVVYNVTDGVTAFTFDLATSTSVEYWGDALVLNVGDLLPEKVYRVTVPSGAIKDMASTPNVFAGTEWSFTTGSRGTYRTIAEIQQPADLATSDASTYVDQYIMTTGVVTHKRSTGFYMQDNITPFSGIYVYDTNTTNAVNVGDPVTLIGQVLEYNKLTEIANILSYQILDPITSPEPVVVMLPFDKTNSEQWESMLVKVENVTYTTMGTSGDEFNVVDGSINTGVIDDYLYIYAPAADEAFDHIAGIMNDFNNAYKLAPRSADDIASGTNSVFDAEQLNLMIYPNPVMDELRIRSEENIAAVEVINLAGQIVASKNKQSITGGEVIVPMAKNDKGVYMVKITTTSGEVIMKKIVKE